MLITAKSEASGGLCSSDSRTHLLAAFDNEFEER